MHFYRYGLSLPKKLYKSKILYKKFYSTDGFVIDQAYLRNIAIIAHVDHGKTTLVDCLLRQSSHLVQTTDSTISNVSSSSLMDRVMDCNDLEKERGITILSKATTFSFGKYRINVVDTPGHADFGGEVERILSMVDGVCLLVDATEGPMTQTKFVLAKALEAGLNPIVVLNKMDRIETVRPDFVDSELLDLFLNLEANESQLAYPLLYASSRSGWTTLENPLPWLRKQADVPTTLNMKPLLETIINYVKPPSGDRTKPFSMLINNLEGNPYLGRCCLGKIETGSVKIGDRIKVLSTTELNLPVKAEASGSLTSTIEEGKVTKIFIRRGGMDQLFVDSASAGDIVSLAGISKGSVNDTLCSPFVTEPLPFTLIDPPTLSIIFSVNTSPLNGKEGKSLTIQQLGERLLKEGETNIALTIRKVNDGYEVLGRGELQLGILVETLRREGCEFSISPPKVVFKTENEQIMEPLEEVVVTVPVEYTGTVVDKLSKRKAELIRMLDMPDSKQRIWLTVPTRSLVGYVSEFKNDTRGSGILTHTFSSYVPFKGTIDSSRKGAIISMALGMTSYYALSDLESRGELFVSPQISVYPGMVIGESTKPGDMTVNPTKIKPCSNIRVASKEELVRLVPAKLMTIEEMIAYMAEDEMMEVTPKSVRLRKQKFIQ